MAATIDTYFLPRLAKPCQAPSPVDGDRNAWFARVARATRLAWAMMPILIQHLPRVGIGWDCDPRRWLVGWA